VSSSDPLTPSTPRPPSGAERGNLIKCSTKTGNPLIALGSVLSALTFFPNSIICPKLPFPDQVPYANLLISRQTHGSDRLTCEHWSSRPQQETEQEASPRHASHPPGLSRRPSGHVFLREAAHLPPGRRLPRHWRVTEPESRPGFLTGRWSGRPPAWLVLFAFFVFCVLPCKSAFRACVWWYSCSNASSVV
jgi:hypothetical protein